MAPTEPPVNTRTFEEFLTVAEARKWQRRSSTKRKSIWNPMSLSRNSSMTSKSGSIPIFVHVGELVKQPGSSPTSPSHPSNNEKTSSFETDPVESDLGVSRTVPNNIMAEMTPQSVFATLPGVSKSRQGEGLQENMSSRRDGDDNNINRRTRSIYALFPDAPKHIDMWFADSSDTETEAEDSMKTPLDKSLPQPPYHVFDRAQKIQVVVLVTLAGILSPLSTAIYLPALTAIASEFHLSYEVVLLTVTVFMVFQGISVFLWMPLCNTLGRRPSLVSMLIVFLAANIGLVFSKSFAAFMVLRAVQSVGSAALTATSGAVIGDISTAMERKRFVGLFGASLLSTMVSPVLGATLTQYLGFRSIFWFLFALGGLILILIIILLPETLRSLAGNGTIRLRPFRQPLVHLLQTSSHPSIAPDSEHPAAQTKELSVGNIFQPLECLLERNVLASALLGSIAFAICTTVITTTPTFFEHYYHISTLAIGLAFLPAGAGAVLSFFFVGYLMDYDLQVVEDQYKQTYDIEQNVKLDHKILADFPIERARLRNAWWITLILIASTAGYGFSFHGYLAGPLVLQFLIASSATAFLLMNGLLVADIYSKQGSTTLAVNLIRFLMGALAIGTVQLVFNRIGTGLTFVTMAGALAALAPLMLLQWIFGRPFRAKRNSTWPRQKLSVELGMPDFGQMAQKPLAALKNMRIFGHRLGD